MTYSVVKAQGIDVFHEVLFELSGTKSAFTSYQFAVRELFQLSEVVLLERILHLGRDYGKLKNFITSIKSKQFNDRDRVGLYLLSFVEFLNRALDPYWNDIVMLEQEITIQPHNSLHFIWSKMHRHSELLSGLLSLVGSVISQGSYGCLLMQHFHQVLSSDIGVIRAAVSIIIIGMNEIFFRQVSCWLFYGDLVDNYQEFFIQENVDEAGSNTPFKKYILRYKMLPNHIEISLADKILAVGQTVLFLRSNPRYSSEDEREDGRQEICIGKNGLFGAKEKKMQEKISKVKELCKWNENGKIEKLVSEVSNFVTLQLWTLAVQDAKLIEQLNLVNEFFLLGRGELFHEFVTLADKYLSRPVMGNLDLNLLLQESARKVLMKEESLSRLTLEYVHEVIDSKVRDSKGDDSEGEWKKLFVRYDAPWPLQLLFSNEALESYNKIFRFLLRLKKIEVKLGECWLFEKSKRRRQFSLKRRQLHRNLWFLVSNLQYYFHVDVLNSQFMILKDVIETSKDFERIQTAHSAFLENLSNQLFLCVEVEEGKARNPIKRSINKILELCEEYCVVVETHGDSGIREDKIECMTTRFEAFVEFLLNHLTRISSQPVQPSSQFLSQFLLRLDFNSFFSHRFSSSLISLYF